MSADPDSADNDASPKAASGAGAAGGKDKTMGISLNSLADASPRCTAVLDVPLANPIFMSDAPSFLQRQRTRAARALVSEHAGTITCACRKCSEAAKARAGPSVSSAWPLPPLCKFGQGDQVTMGGSMSSTAAPPPGSAASSRRPASSKRLPGEACGAPSSVPSPTEQPLSPGQVASQPRDFVWMLRVLSEAVPAVDAGPGGSPPVAGVVNYDGSFTPDPGSMLGKLGILIPDTVVLEKGKPKKRYSIDSTGRVQVTKMKTSAELLRVLRDFVRKATKPREAISRRAANGSLAAGKGMRASRSEGSLQVGSTRRGSKTASATSFAAEGSFADPSFSSGGPTTDPFVEVAKLEYNDGMSRLMMYSEAVGQMKGASKLPREFWQHIHVLQVPVQSKMPGVPTRYITYSYDANNGGWEPQEPMPLGGGPRAQLRPVPVPAESDAAAWGAEKQKQQQSEAARLAAVPKRLNEQLAAKTRKQGLELVTGQFEFVLDEADGTLWLVNASNLRCRLLPSSSRQLEKSERAEEVMRFFEEDEFEDEMRETVVEMEQMRKRFGGDPGVANGGSGVGGIAVSATDSLAGVTVPKKLYSFYEEEEKMLKYYEDEVRVMAHRREKPKCEGSKAVGLGCWFRRWLRGVKGRNAVRPRQRKGPSVIRDKLSP